MRYPVYTPVRYSNSILRYEDFISSVVDFERIPLAGRSNLTK